jgi:hypothetical protein
MTDREAPMTEADAAKLATAIENGYWEILHGGMMHDTILPQEKRDLIVAALRSLPASGTAGEEERDDFFDMLWVWFEDEERVGVEGMRPERREGLSADDFKTMLDEHEAALIDGLEQARSGALADAMKLIEDLRIRSASNFADDNCKGQRGQDRCDALYDAYHAIRAIAQAPGAAHTRQGDEK